MVYPNYVARASFLISVDKRIALVAIGVNLSLILEDALAGYAGEVADGIAGASFIGVVLREILRDYVGVTMDNSV